MARLMVRWETLVLYEAEIEISNYDPSEEIDDSILADHEENGHLAILERDATSVRVI